MKTALISIAILLFHQIKAQTMNTPESAVIQLFVATDNKDWNTLSSTLAQEIYLDYSSMTGNADGFITPKALIDGWKGLLPGFDFTHHQLGNLQIESIDSTAKISCYGTASHYLENQGENIWIVIGTYDFKLAQSDDGNWKITSMTFNYKFQTGNPNLPVLASEKVKATK